ncbi:MAG: glycosyltransferase family 4 protein [Actinobacteria bacterium]|nr:glycosyltransferase family 4 protein [Actinomycetota bacterium]
MTKLVFVTQTLDPAHGALAQTIDLVHALAVRVDRLVVITRDDRWGQAPANVEVKTFDAPGRASRVLAFERMLASALPGADGALVHMVPTFLVLAAPLAKARGIPLLLWYTHWHASRSLHIATALCDVALSVEVTSFPIQSAKVRGIGHAIDVDEFSATPPAAHDGPVRLLALGRTARWKGLHTLIDAFSSTELAATLEIRGPSLTADERAHRAELVEAAGLDARIRIEPALERVAVPDLLRSVDIVVSPAEPRAGATLDKAVYEAAACARPVVTTNAALQGFLSGLPLELVAPPSDPAALAKVLSEVVLADSITRAAIGAELRRRVVSGHSVGHWADAVVATVREVRSPRGG